MLALNLPTIWKQWCVQAQCPMSLPMQLHTVMKSEPTLRNTGLSTHWNYLHSGVNIKVVATKPVWAINRIPERAKTEMLYSQGPSAVGPPSVCNRRVEKTGETAFSLCSNRRKRRQAGQVAPTPHPTLQIWGLEILGRRICEYPRWLDNTACVLESSSRIQACC